MEGGALKVLWGGMVGRKKPSEPEKMLMRFETRQSDALRFEHDDDACVRRIERYPRGPDISLVFRREA